MQDVFMSAFVDELEKVSASFASVGATKTNPQNRAARKEMATFFKALPKGQRNKSISDTKDSMRFTKKLRWMNRPASF